MHLIALALKVSYTLIELPNPIYESNLHSKNDSEIIVSNYPSISERRKGDALN